MNSINLHVGMKYYVDISGQRYNHIYTVAEITDTDVTVTRGRGSNTYIDKDEFIKSFSGINPRILANKTYEYEIY